MSASDDDDDDDDLERIQAQWAALRRLAEDPTSAGVRDLLEVEGIVLELLLGRLTFDRPAGAEAVMQAAHDRLEAVQVFLDQAGGWPQ